MDSGISSFCQAGKTMGKQLFEALRKMKSIGPINPQGAPTMKFSACCASLGNSVPLKTIWNALAALPSSPLPGKRRKKHLSPKELRLNEEVGTFEFDLFFLLNYQHTPNHISDPGLLQNFFELLSGKIIIDPTVQKETSCSPRRPSIAPLLVYHFE